MYAQERADDCSLSTRLMAAGLRAPRPKGRTHRLTIFGTARGTVANGTWQEPEDILKIFRYIVEDKRMQRVVVDRLTVGELGTNRLPY